VVHLLYRVYASKLSDDATQFDSTHALLNGSSLFLAARGQERTVHQVSIALPERWRAATALAAAAGGHGWEANGYEELIDAPIECGRFVDAEIVSGGRSYRIAIDGATTVPDKLLRDLGRIADAEAAMVGAQPFRHYLVVIHLADGPGRIAALEHAASTSIIVPSQSLVDPEEYEDLIYVIAHELFHVWNARRLRPAEMTPYDLLHPQAARSLWIVEGLTDYYAHRALRFAGRWTQPQYLRHVADEAARAVASARHGLTLEEAAELAWQPPDDEQANEWDAYYARGHLVALALDAKLRAATDGRRSLDDVMRSLLAAAEHAGGALPINTAALARAVDAEVAGLGADVLLWARTPEETTLVAEQLGALGLQLNVQVHPTRAYAGFVADREGGVLHVLSVEAEGPASEAGLRAGDRILQLDGAAPPAKWPEVIGAKSVGAPLKLEVQRSRRRLQLRVYLAPLDEVDATLQPTAASPRVTQLRSAWLGP
jgi:predicted metalloprotease with PDZ domain